MPTILHVCYPTDLYGTEQSLLLLVAGLKHKGYRSIVAVPRQGPLTERLESLGIPVVYVPLRPWLTSYHVGLKRKIYNIYHLPYLFRNAGTLVRIIRDYEIDLVHTSNTVVFDGALAAIATCLPHVWHIRDTIEPGGFLKFSFGSKLARYIMKCFSSRMIVISEAIGSAYVAKPKDWKKISIIHNGVDIAPFDKSLHLEAAREKYDLAIMSKVVGMIAQMHSRKRHQDFLQAASIVCDQLPNTLFFIVGGEANETNAYSIAIKQLSRELGITKQIKWLNFQTNVVDILKTIDLLVVPSDDEPFGRVAIEAMAASKPVVATRVGGIPEVVVDGVTGLLVPPRCPEELAHAILKILKHEKLGSSMGIAGRNRVEQHFSAEKYVENVTNVYKELLPDYQNE